MNNIYVLSGELAQVGDVGVGRGPRTLSAPLRRATSLLRWRDVTERHVWRWSVAYTPLRRDRTPSLVYPRVTSRATCLISFKQHLKANLLLRRETRAVEVAERSGWGTTYRWRLPLVNDNLVRWKTMIALVCRTLERWFPSELTGSYADMYHNRVVFTFKCVVSLRDHNKQWVFMEYVRAVALRRRPGGYSFHVGWAGGRQHNVSCMRGGSFAIDSAYSAADASCSPIYN